MAETVFKTTLSLSQKDINNLEKLKKIWQCNTPNAIKTAIELMAFQMGDKK